MRIRTTSFHCIIASGVLGVLLLGLSIPEAAASESTLRAADAIDGDRFGTSVAIDGDTAVIGAVAAGRAQEKDGAVYVFVRSGNAWVQEARLEAEDATDRQRLF